MSMSVETERQEGEASSDGRPAPRHQSPNWIGQLAWPALFILLGLAALKIDLPLAQWIRNKGLPGGLKKLFELAEVFGHGAGAMAILLTAWVLAPSQRLRLPRAIGATYLAGLGANVVKLCLARARPHAVDRLLDISVMDTFHGWFPGLANSSGWQGFPSSHTAVAAGLAVGLSWVFPRGKWLFAAFAVLAAGQRIASGNHFLSDVLWGAATGWICAGACLPGGWLSPVFDRLQSWQIARSEHSGR